MINLRYHIVSITAVFLALGIGITMGSTFLGKATLDRIDSNVKNAKAEVTHVKDENSALRNQVSISQSRAADFLREALGREFNGELQDVPVVVIAADGVDQDTLNNLRTALTASGAAFDGTLTVTTKFELNGGDATDLAKLLGLSTPSVGTARRDVVTSVADELLAATRAAPTSSTGKGSTTTTTPGAVTTLPVTTTRPDPAPTTGSTEPGASVTTAPASTTTTTLPPKPVAPAVITKLIHAGYFDYAPALGGVDGSALLTQDGYRYVVVTGSTATIPDADFIRPLLEDMTADGPAPVVVASAAVGDDPESVRGASIDPLIKDPAIGDQVTTVDDLEQFSGIDAVVLSLQDLADGRHGHYGVGNSAKSQLPQAHG